jgi:peptide/nickel transport system substrate-binding protein
MAQQLLDTITESQVKHLGLHGLLDQPSGQRWGGPPTALLVRDDAPHLVEIAGAVAALIGQPGHEITATPTAAASIAARRADRRFDLLLDFVRPVDTSTSPLLPLLTAAGRGLARRPPRDTGLPARDITRTLALGLVGELRIEGARVPDVRGIDGWTLGDAWRNR